jgi:hypothetical protein
MIMDELWLYAAGNHLKHGRDLGSMDGVEYTILPSLQQPANVWQQMVWKHT